MITAEQISQNWESLISVINYQISEPRRTNLLKLYNNYSERMIMMPAAHKKEYHNAFPGGYVDHVLRVIECAVKINKVWKEMGVDSTTYTQEELIFSALNHDLGKIGDIDNESYIPQTDEWRKNKLGEDYMFNTSLAFASVPDRGLFLLQENGIPYTFNEMITIQTHDGLYDEGNKKYLMGFGVESKPRTSLPFIIHQADLMAARIEFEKEWLPKLKVDKSKVNTNFKLVTTKNTPIKSKALSTIKSPNLQNMLNKI